MRFLKLFIPLFIVLATFVACSSLFDNGNDGPELTLKSTPSPGTTVTFNGDTVVFNPVRDNSGEIMKEYPPFKSQVKNQQIVINGYYLASAGFIPEGLIKRTDEELEILVRMKPEEDDVPDEPRGFFYNAFIRNLTKGNYTVIIIHKNDLMRGTRGEKHIIFNEEFVIK